MPKIGKNATPSPRRILVLEHIMCLAFNYTSRLQRQSLNIEGYKFLFDYHGFVPNLGAGIGRENLEFTRTEFGDDLDPITEQTWSPNIVFGWDIRPSVKGDW